MSAVQRVSGVKTYDEFRSVPDRRAGGEHCLLLAHAASSAARAAYHRKDGFGGARRLLVLSGFPRRDQNSCKMAAGFAPAATLSSKYMSGPTKPLMD